MANYDNFHWESHRDGPKDLIDTNDRCDQELEEFEYFDETEVRWVDNRTPAMKEVHDELERLAQQQDLKWVEAQKNDDTTENLLEYLAEKWDDDIQPPSNPKPVYEPVFHPPVFEIR